MAAQANKNSHFNSFKENSHDRLQHTLQHIAEEIV
jgi:hypothetical protein